jgi:mediator of RNA polymerase II transcription subunit 7
VLHAGRRQALHALLHTLLHTYLRLLGALTSGPPSLHAETSFLSSLSSAPPPNLDSAAAALALRTQADAAVAHIRLASINVHHLCNEWRPVQARETLRALMRAQIAARRRKTDELRR